MPTRQYYAARAAARLAKAARDHQQRMQQPPPGKRPTLRKVIQIAVADNSSGSSEDFGSDQMVFALCNDGSFWVTTWRGDHWAEWDAMDLPPGCLEPP